MAGKLSQSCFSLASNVAGQEMLKIIVRKKSEYIVLYYQIKEHAIIHSSRSPKLAK